LSVDCRSCVRPGSDRVADTRRLARLAALLASALLVLPPTASAQRDQFFDALLPFYRSLTGTFGDEGPRLTAQLETLSRALTRWDQALEATERTLRARLKDGDARTALEVHTVLASLYAERSRYDEALREIEQAIRVDAARAPLHRFKALLYLAGNRPADAADAFRAAWLLEPEDPRNAYHLVVRKSVRTTVPEMERALGTLARIERELTRGERANADSPFLTLNSITDDVGGALAFAPAAYAPSFALLLEGEFEKGMSALRAAVAADPLVADPASHSEPMTRGIAALRQGLVEQALEHMNSAVTGAPDSSEARRILGTVYGVAGDTEKSLQHLHEAVRLNPLDERSWVALARALDAAGAWPEAMAVLREGVGTLTDSGALRWMLSSTVGTRQRTDEIDLELVAMAERLVLLAGRGELYGRLGAFAQSHLDYDRAMNLLEQRVRLTPNSAAAHRALGQAYVGQGREDEAYAELVVALMLNSADVDTLTTIGRLHMSAGRYPAAVETLTRAVALQPDNLQAVHAQTDSLLRAGRLVEGEQQRKEAERLQERAVEQQRRLRTLGMLAVQAEVQMRERQYVSAIATWQRLIQIEGGKATSHLRLAEALAGAGRLEEAASQIQQAIATRNAGPEAHRRLAEVYASLGRNDESARARRLYVEQSLRQLGELQGYTAALAR
jgi:tetratricopeptide (TPR) repeat protein